MEGPGGQGAAGAPVSHSSLEDEEQEQVGLAWVLQWDEEPQGEVDPAVWWALGFLLGFDWKVCCYVRDDQHWSGRPPQTGFSWEGEETVVLHMRYRGLRREPAVLGGVIMLFPELLFLSLGIVLFSDFLHVLLQTEPHQF